MKKFVLLQRVFVFLIALGACSGGQDKGGEGTGRSESIIDGELQVLVDETVFPIMEEQEAVFEHRYKGAEVSLIAAQEGQIAARLANHEAEVGVLTRQLNDEEMKFFEARQFTPRVHRIAQDALALIVNKSSPDSTITVDDIISVMRGEQLEGRSARLVFDNPNSSTVGYLKTLAGVDSLPATGVYALKSNKDVLQYVYETPSTIGVVGLNWIVRPDSTTRKFVNGIRVLGVKGQAGKSGSDGFYKPSQSNLAEGLYPLPRPVYIINAQPRKGLGMGFAAFLTGEAGQRIILKSGLMPDSLPPRELIIRKQMRSN